MEQTATKQFVIDENWSLEYDDQSTNLIHKEIRPNLKGEPTEYVQKYYYAHTKQALKAYVIKSVNGCASVDKILQRMDEIEENINKLVVKERWHK